MILARSTLSLISYSTVAETQPLEQFLGMTLPELDAAWVARDDNLDEEQLGAWIEENQPGEVAGMTLRAATTGDSYRVNNEKPGLTLEGAFS